MRNFVILPIGRQACLPIGRFKMKNKINLKHNKGQAMLITVMFFIFIFLSFIVAFSAPALIELGASRDLIDSKKSYFLAESAAEDIAYRIKNGELYDINEVLNIGGFYATATVANLLGDEKEITSTANFLNSIRKVKINFITDNGVSFNYGVQAGDGGFNMENSSTISGNAYSNGPVSGQNSNLVKGDIVSAGAGGLISGIHATSSAYANSITNSVIDRDAYYSSNLTNTTVNGNIYPGSADKPNASLPISQDIINEWEATAASSTISSPCPYIINGSVSLGPVKISCNLEIKSSAVINLLGSVWVLGNIEIENNAILRVDPSLQKKSVVMIADNPSNRTTSSKIELENSAEFQNSGIKGSYIMMLSENNSAESGGGEKAITIENSVSGDVILYSNHGEVLLKNNVNLREVTAYRIRLQNTANVTYETGLANTVFKSGPSGGYSINKWQETN